uniref:VWFA domain-containing protein n=1 Tax=Terrapene triunguis TaxID=2587831 RepID=A0A674KHD4_9SAUR
MLENHFKETAGSRREEGVPQIAVVITDGQAQDNIQEPAKEIKDAGITLYAIGIKGASLVELQEIASEPDDKHVYEVEDFTDLQDISHNMLQVLCTTVEEVNQIAHVSQGMSTSPCSPPPLFSLPFCRKATLADIVFLVDTSTSIGRENFQKVKNFLYTLLDVGIDKYRVGLAQYSREGHVEFLLNTYKSKEDVLTHIQGRVTFLGGPLQTGSALEFLHKVFFKEEVGSRISQGTPQFAVVITSAKSKDDVAEAAEELKEIGVKVISVGVQNSDREEMEVIATSPLVYQVNGGQSISHCWFLLINYPNLCSSASVADIVFLVDESSRIGLRNFQLTRTFLLKIVNALDIGPNNIRVGLVLYSDEPRLEFTLDTFEDKSDILNYLKKLPYRGGRTYTGAAIDFLRKKVFTQEAGSRKNQGVQQLAVVITDGQSFDDFVEHGDAADAKML